LFFRPFLSFLKIFKKLNFLAPVKNFPFYENSKNYKKFNKIFKRELRFKAFMRSSLSLKLPYNKVILKILTSSRLRQKRLRLYRIFYFYQTDPDAGKKDLWAFRRKFRLGKRRRMRMKKVSGLRLRHYLFCFQKKNVSNFLKIKRRKKLSLKIKYLDL